MREFSSEKMRLYAARYQIAFFAARFQPWITEPTRIASKKRIADPEYRDPEIAGRGITRDLRSTDISDLSELGCSEARPRAFLPRR